MKGAFVGMGALTVLAGCGEMLFMPRSASTLERSVDRVMRRIPDLVDARPEEATAQTKALQRMLGRTLDTYTTVMQSKGVECVAAHEDGARRVNVKAARWIFFWQRTQLQRASALAIPLVGEVIAQHLASGAHCTPSTPS